VRTAAENRGGAEKKIAEIDQIGFSSVERLGVEDPRVDCSAASSFSFRAFRQHGLVAIDRKCGDPSDHCGDQERDHDNPETADPHYFCTCFECRFPQAEPGSRVLQRNDEFLGRTPQFSGCRPVAGPPTETSSLSSSILPSMAPASSRSVAFKLPAKKRPMHEFNAGDVVAHVLPARCR